MARLCGTSAWKGHVQLLPTRFFLFMHFVATSSLSLLLLYFHFVLVQEIKENLNMSTIETSEYLERTHLPKNFDDGGFFDLGHPLLNRVAHSFVRAAGIGALQSISQQAYYMASDGVNGDKSGVVSDTGEGDRGRRYPGLEGDNYSKSLESLVKTTGKQTFQWGLAAGMYSGIQYGLEKGRGSHDWKNSTVAGALTGAAVALTSDNTSHDNIVKFAITGAALSAAANLLSGVF